MVFTPYTGKSVGALLTWNAVPVPGWRRVVIEEQAGPLPETLDKTAAADSAYAYMDDPMGAKGQKKVTITVDGLASQTDVADTGLFSHAMNDAHAFELQKAAGAGKDEFTVTPLLKRRSRPGEVRALVPFTLVWEYDGTGTWAASGA